MKIFIKKILRESLNEIDYVNDYPDISKTSSCVPTEFVVKKMNAELDRIRQKKSSDNNIKKNAPERGKAEPYFPIYMDKTKNDVLDDEGLGIDINKYINLITQKPKSLLDQNKKMEKSDVGGYQTTYNTGLPALVAIGYDMDRKSFLILNTCPGAGACQRYCYARGGQFGMNDGLIVKEIQRLNLLLNNPEEYYNMLMDELEPAALKVKREARRQGINKKLVIRWNDSGDFFADKYMQIAKRITDELIAMGYPVKSYAYTKIAKYYNMGDENFVMNFSKGAKQSEMDKLDFNKIKYSDVVPVEIDDKVTGEIKPIFSDLFVRVKGKFVEDPKTGLPRFVEGGADELKQRISKLNNVPLDTLLYQSELPREENGKDTYNTIVLPNNDSDISAQRHDVRITFLTIHK